MNNFIKCGKVLSVLLIFSLMAIAFSAQNAWANEDARDATREAIDAIGEIRRVDRIVSLDQSAVDDVDRARELVHYAKSEYGAEDDDFPNLDKLHEAEEKVEKLVAVDEAKEAMADIPPPSEITEADRYKVEDARALVNYAIEEHGASRFDLCWGLDALEAAEEELDDPDPAPDPAPDPDDPDDELPPTGGFTIPIISGLVLSGAGFMFMRRKYRGRH